MPVRSDATTLVGTYDGHGPAAWTDLSPHSMFKDPNILIPAAEVTLHSEDQDRQDLYLRERKVIYTETVLNVTYKYLLNLVFYTQPAGAGALTVTATVGKMITEAGALGVDTDTHSLVAGVSLGKYFFVGVDSFGEAAIGEYGVSSLAADAFVSTTIPEGAGVWLIRSGTVVADFDGVGTEAVGSKMTGAAAGEFTNTVHGTGEPALADNYGESFFGIVRVDPNAAAPTNLGILDLRLPERLPPIS